MVAQLGWRPVVRSALTSCTLMACGDTISQAIRSHAARKEVVIDSLQTARFAIIGATWHGPYFFTGFRWLDRTFGSSATLAKAATKTLVGQVTLFPVYVVSFFYYMGALEGLNHAERIEKVRRAAPPTLISGTVFWPIANIFNFLYVPAAYRVVYVNVAGLFWNAFLSWENSTKGAVKEISNSVPIPHSKKPR